MSGIKIDPSTGQVIDRVAASLPSPGEVLLVGPSAGISIAAGATYTSPAYNALGMRGVAYFTDLALYPNQVTSNLSAYTSLLTNPQPIFICGNTTAQNWNPTGASFSMTGIPTNTVKVSLSADSANTAAVTINGISLGVW